ncbi:glycosyltransferase family 10 domain-containing protein [Pedobacter sp. Hv1]|uniref:glycosyltransferase family 10 domain-containing protein n=1 Tax=Pedobacter sp. Hv1 TaxID=1740090 RepID=UPI0006D8A136|nr:glycosyltransferase family 10 [Pedobacter sp. Hv1]KQC02424.1 hypothetical protein AQF98_02260 [Pedobacter sp. Hv1]
MLKQIKLKCQNGLTFEHTLADVLIDLTDKFEFIESENPDFIIFGPYGNDIPKSGNYVRIGYFCENIYPDLSICDYAFGIPSESEINDPKYRRIQWHGINPKKLIKNLTDNDIDQILNSKSKFCNFLYSNRVPYREEFFKQLSKYKKVDAPGKSMNNMPSIDELFKGDMWERKRQFIAPYKFTIAFENYVYPGYQTEKLYDAMQSYSLPIYCGDPNISEIFNINSFVNVPDYISASAGPILKVLENTAQQNFKDYRPSFHQSFLRKIIRRLKANGRELKMKIQFNKLDFSQLIDRIIEIDQDENLYIQYLKQPWFNNNGVPINSKLDNRWSDIFNSKK